MHLSVATQRSWKRKLLARELLRASVIDDEATVADVVSGAEQGYRIRSRLHMRGGRFGTLGARSHEVVPLCHCPVMSPPLERFALDLGENVEQARPGDAEVELYVDAAGRRGLFVSRFDKRMAKSWEELARSVAVEALVLDIREGRRGPRPFRIGALEERSDGRALAFEPGLFVQSNREMNSRLVQAVLSDADQGGRTFAEVYAGVGNFTVHLASRFEGGAAFERDKRAVTMLQRNLGDAATRVRAKACHDTDAARSLSTMGQIDLLVVDPPRAGMKPLANGFFCSTKHLPERVAMVSCHPMSAVRDLSLLVHSAGYRLVTIVPVDLFPQTHHLELVAVLERG